MLATKLEPRPLKEDTSFGQLVTSPVQLDVERSCTNERDGPATTHLLLGVVVHLVRRVVDAADREVWRLVQDLVTVQWRDSWLIRCEV